MGVERETPLTRRRRGCGYDLRVPANARSLDGAVEALKRDPAEPVRVTVGDLTVELRAVDANTAVQVGNGSAADVFREIGAWEGETLEELLEFFEARRQGGSRSVPHS
jgi:hypothetical protein